MQRTVTGFHQDAEGDWVAELSCGHNQHVRHRPPFQERPWVLDAAGRDERLGTFLGCPLCDRAELPEAVRHVRSGPEWDERTLPQGLRRAHRLGPGSWGTIRVHDGRLRFSMESDPPLSVELVPRSGAQAIPPEVEHEVEPLGRVRFSLELFAVEPPREARNGGRAVNAEKGLPGLSELFDAHVAAEFVAKDADVTMATMNDDPTVIHVPTLTGGRGRDELHAFYRDHFIPSWPDDVELVPLSRTVDRERVVDEFIVRFTHSRVMPYWLPGIAPTGRTVEIPHVVVMGFEEGKVAYEHIYWDQASLLVQIGLLDPGRLPVVGSATARALLDADVPMNEIITAPS